MPYKIRVTKDGKYLIINKDTNKIVGRSKTLKDAKASINARLAGAHGWKGTKK